MEGHQPEQPVLASGVKVVATAAGEPIGSMKAGESYLIQLSIYSKNPHQVNIYDPLKGTWVGATIPIFKTYGSIT